MDQFDLSRPIARAIECYVNTRDLEKAAAYADMSEKRLKKIFRQPEIRAEIDKRILNLDKALAESMAKSALLTLERVDAETIKVFDSSLLSETMSARVRLIDTAYKRFGALTEKREVAGAGGAPLTFEVVRMGSKKTA